MSGYPNNKDTVSKSSSNNQTLKRNVEDKNISRSRLLKFEDMAV